MKCQECQFVNPKEMQSCVQCGAALERVCLKCHFPNPPQFKFCGECGFNLALPSAPVYGRETVKFYGLLTLVLALLQRFGRISYSALKLQFDLDDDHLEALKVEIIEIQRLAVDQNDKMLVWIGGERPPVQMAGPPRTTPESVATLSPVSPPPLPSATNSTTPEVEPTAASEAVLSVAPEPETRLDNGERRQVTVMFCDLAGSTTLSCEFDPEDFREVIRSFQETSAKVIQSFEGYIAQYLGDGLLVYFGFPQAHEDDAQRAIHAGLSILDEMKTLNTFLERDKGVQLAVRVGIHTGLVVVGEMGGGNRQERLAMGETPNIAARLETMAHPDTVVISGTTARLVRAAFALEDLGARELRGVPEPIEVFRVLQSVGVQMEDETTGADRRVPLVGRDEEVGLLLRRWEQSKEGLGQVVMIMGEAGIGKSSLVEEVRGQVVREGHVRINFLCSPYHTNSALYPVIGHLERFLKIQLEDSPGTKLDKLEQGLGPYNLPLQETVPLLATLLTVPLLDRYSTPITTPQKRKCQTLDILVTWLLEEAERQPLLAVWEDLQWADPSTLEMLGLVIYQTPTAPILNLLTFRPEFVPPWTTRSHITPLTLSRLERPQIKAMVQHLAGQKELPTEVIEHIISKTDGVPLYVEELTKVLLESGLLHEEANRYELIGPLSTLSIPDTLQASLMARLDRLPMVREVAQLAAVMGREFAYEILCSLGVVEEPTLQEGLNKLVDAELLYQRGRFPKAKYIFKHALIRDAAYSSLLKSTRKKYHQQIARTLEVRFSENMQKQPELLAHHYTEASCNEQAIDYWHRAGKLAITSSANLEAINHLNKGLKVLKKLPKTSQRAQQELHLLTTLGPALMITEGYAAPETEQVYNRARKLCQQVGETPKLFPVLAGLWRFHLLRAEYSIAQEFAQQLLGLAERSQDRALLLEAHRALGSTLFYQGELSAARTHLEQGIALYDPQQHRTMAFQYGQDPRVVCQSYAAWVLWLLGWPDQARKETRAAIASAQELAHPFSLAFALSFAAWHYQFCRELERTREMAETALALSIDQKFHFWEGWDMILKGWALAVKKPGEAEITQMKQGLDRWRAKGSELGRPYFLALLAEVCGKAGQAEEGQRLIAEALAVVDSTGEYWCEAELHRLKGELLLTVSGENEVEAEICFNQALTIAQGQQAKSLELRAAMSLSRLWKRKDKAGKPRKLLMGLYEQFTEGFDTADLQDAKALVHDSGNKF